MATVQHLKTLDDWRALFDSLTAPDAAPVLLFKFSPICPVSHRAEHAFDEFVATLADSKLRIVKVNVINERPVSRQIAADTEVEHESPQVFLILGGKRIEWHASHGDINAQSLAENSSRAK